VRGVLSSVRTVFVRSLMWGRSRRPRGRPRKTPAQLVADGTFLARRHGGLLAGESVDEPTLAGLQRMYRRAESDRQRRKIAIAFEKLVREATPAEEPDVEAAVEFEEPLAVRESPAEVMGRVWRLAEPWRDRGVDPADGMRIRTSGRANP
jgi:hypothetical protein